MFPISDVIPSRTTPVVTVSLIVINSVVFLYQWMLPQHALQVFTAHYALIPAYFSVSAVLTSMFLHGGWMHIIGNMLYLWIFGDNIEDQLGHAGFLVFYLASGAVAAAGQVVINPYSVVPMVGASGAIAGVMGAYFVLYPESRILTAIFIFFFFDLVEVPAIFFLGIWFLMQLLSGVGSLGVSNASAGGTAFFAHIGGFVAGLLVGAVLRVRGGRHW
jgi:membrane associated rhomboid family serine protease